MSLSRARFSTWCNLAALAAFAGCGLYSFTGGGGLPGHVQTIAILPFDNRTPQVTLAQELGLTLDRVVPGRLGVTQSNEMNADAILRGTINSYANTATNYQDQPGGPVIFQRRVTITISAEIFDVHEDRAIWKASSLSATGEYQPDREPEDAGRQLAIDNLVLAIIDGAQSQW